MPRTRLDIANINFLLKVQSKKGKELDREGMSHIIQKLFIIYRKVEKRIMQVSLLNKVK